MAWVYVQMVKAPVSPRWWKELVRYFANVGDAVEIRCWKEETGEIKQAMKYGEVVEDGNEVSVKGKVTPGLIAELSGEEPKERGIYNKMTKYFTVNIYHKSRIFSSEHYGTEIYLSGSENDISATIKALEPYGDDFSIAAGE